MIAITMRYVIILVFMACLPVAEAALKAQDQPNFILILADDQGYSDLGCFGSKTIQTPVKHALAYSESRLDSCMDWFLSVEW